MWNSHLTCCVRPDGGLVPGRTAVPFHAWNDRLLTSIHRNDVAAKKNILVVDWWALQDCSVPPPLLSADSRSVLHLQVGGALEMKFFGHACRPLQQMILSPHSSGHLALTNAEERTPDSFWGGCCVRCFSKEALDLPPIHLLPPHFMLIWKMRRGGGGGRVGWGGAFVFHCCAIFRWSHWPNVYKQQRRSGVHATPSAECTLLSLCSFLRRREKKKRKIPPPFL